MSTPNCSCLLSDGSRCKSKASTALFETNHCYGDCMQVTPHECNRIRFCCSCAVCKIGKDDKYMNFLYKRQVEEYLQLCSNNSPSRSFSKERFVVISLCNLTKFVPQQTVAEELPGVGINPLADRFDRNHKSNSLGQL